MDAPVGSAGPARKAGPPIAVVLLIVSVALLVQFLLGITVNIFVKLPLAHPGANAADYFVGITPALSWAVAREWPWLSLHVVIGTLLVVSSITALPPALRSRRTAVIFFSVLGAVGALSAAMNGAAFVMYGQDWSSMLMAASFAVALGAVITRLYLTRAAPVRPT